MYWRYSRGSTLARLIRDLMRILRQLLVVFDGDVEESIDYLEKIAERYKLWREDFGPSDFRRLLEQGGEVAPGKSGLRLTRKGERAIRRQMLHDVFAKMSRKGPGDHRLPEPGGAG